LTSLVNKGHLSPSAGPATPAPAIDPLPADAAVSGASAERRLRLACVGIGLVIATIVALLATLKPFGSGPQSKPAGAGASQRVAAVTGGPVTLAYGASGWKLSSAKSAAGAPAGLLSQSSPSLSAGAVTAAAGVLAQPAPIPGQAPPQIVARYGRPTASSARFAQHAAEQYRWTLPAGHQLVAYVLPTSGADLALLCSTSSQLAPALRSCNALAARAHVSNVTVVSAGPSAAVQAALSHDLAPVSKAIDQLSTSASHGSPSMLASWAALAGVEQTADNQLGTAKVPARDLPAVTALRRALAAEGSAFGSLAVAAQATTYGPGYQRAQSALRATGIALGASTHRLVAEGFTLPTLPALTTSMVSVATPSTHKAPTTAPSHPATHSSTTGSSKPSSTTHSTTPSTANNTGSAPSTSSSNATSSSSGATSSPAAPRSTYVPPTEPTHPSTPSTSSSSSSSSAASSKPSSSSPSVVVVGTGGGQSKSSSGVVVVPTG